MKWTEGVLAYWRGRWWLCWRHPHPKPCLACPAQNEFLFSLYSPTRGSFVGYLYIILISYLCQNTEKIKSMSEVNWGSLGRLKRTMITLLTSSLFEALFGWPCSIFLFSLHSSIRSWFKGYLYINLISIIIFDFPPTPSPNGMLLDHRVTPSI